MVQGEEMRVDLKTIKQHCRERECEDCALNNGICMFFIPPEQWTVEVMELAILKISTDKARESIDGRMGE